MTEQNRPLILITNDDGVYAKGINELINHLKDLGDIVVIAPDGARSGMSSAITSINPIRINKIKEYDNIIIFSCSGTPVDCIKLGINEILDRKPDLIVSGINHGSNSAVSVIYSGTLGAAIEGCIFGIPSIGISLTDHSPDADFSLALEYGKKIVKNTLKEGLPSGICLNLNIPNTQKIKGLKICSQTKGYWSKEFQKAKDPSGKTIYWLTGEFYNEDLDNTYNDEWALKHGYAALVPVQIDMTAYKAIEALKGWEINI
ncbi:5'/3'-nucleotidase SurE [Bacteroidales bacterium OttesenSCG-928-M06]|nr:5'/3'-nucleotidase SurE [Bacteroidales bacterium OttesenSCG-928-M06]